MRKQLPSTYIFWYFVEWMQACRTFSQNKCLLSRTYSVYLLLTCPWIPRSIFYSSPNWEKCLLQFPTLWVAITQAMQNGLGTIFAIPHLMCVIVFSTLYCLPCYMFAKKVEDLIQHSYTKFYLVLENITVIYFDTS